MTAATAEVVEDLELRTHKRVRLFPESEFAPTPGELLEQVVCSSKYGICLSVLPQNRIHSFRTADLHSLEKINETEPEVTNLNSRVVNYFQENIKLKYLHLSCNGRVLSAAVDTPSGPFLHLFDILAFAPDVQTQPFPVVVIKASSGADQIACVEWNPEIEEMVAVGTSDGTLSTFRFSLTNSSTYSLVGSVQLSAPSTCMSWSRKGKQLMVGDAAGRLHQLKPELQTVRVVEAPAQLPGVGKLTNLKTRQLAASGTPVACAGLFWVSTTDWLVAYREHSDPFKLTLAFLTVKKNQPPAWTFYGDVTFQRPNSPPYDSALHFVPLVEWDMVFVYAHRSPDVVVLGQRNGQWVNFVMERFTITMPLNQQKGDSQPIGCALDLSLQSNVVLDRGNQESPVLPPQPVIYVLASTGLLLSYHVCSLDPARLSPIVKPIGYTSQEMRNGAPPAGFVPRSAPIQHPTAQPTQLNFGVPSILEPPMSTRPCHQLPISQPLVAPPTQNLRVHESAPPAAVPIEADRSRQLEAELEKSVVVYCQNQSVLMTNLERFALIRSLIEERAHGFDASGIDELWELLRRVQQSLDDGVHSTELVGRQMAGLTARIRQCASVYDRYHDKQRIPPPTSSFLDELVAAEKRFNLLKAETQKLESAFKNFQDEHKTSTISGRSSSSPRPVVTELAISTEDQRKVNATNEEIGRRVARYARKVTFIQQRLQLIRTFAERNLNVDKTPPTTCADRRSEDVNEVVEDLRRFLLIVDSDAPPSAARMPASLTPVDERQRALRRLMSAHAQRPRPVFRVCPKKLVVDETLASTTPRRERVDEDAGIGRQIIAARNSPIVAPRSPAAPRLVGSLTLGTPVSPVALLNAAKSATVAEVPTQRAPVSTPVVLTPASVAQTEKSPPAPKQPSFLSPVTPTAVEVPSSSLVPIKLETLTAPSVQPTKPNETPATTQPQTTTTTATTSVFSFAPTVSTAASSTITTTKPADAASFLFAPTTKPTTSGFFSSPTSTTTSAKPTSFSFMPQQTVPATTAASNPVAFSFVPKSTAQPTANADVGMEEDSNAASSFSFAGTGLGSTVATNKTGGGFGSLNWGSMTQKPAAPSSPFAAAPTQTPPTSSGFGSKTSAFGAGPSFGSGRAFGAAPSFGSPPANSPFANASSPSSAPVTGGFSAFANQASSFGQLAQQSPAQSGGIFGSPQQSGFGGSPFGGGGTSAFGTGSTFASQNKSSAFTAFRK